MKSWRSSTYLLLTFFQTITSNLPFAPPEVQQCRKNMPDFCTLDQQRQISKNTHLITVKKQAMTIADCECCLRLRITENNGKSLSQNSVFIQNITFSHFFCLLIIFMRIFWCWGMEKQKHSIFTVLFWKISSRERLKQDPIKSAAFQIHYLVRGWNMWWPSTVRVFL